MENTKKTLVNLDTKVVRNYSKKEQKPLNKGVMPSTQNMHTRLAYTDKTPRNCPMKNLKSMWKG